MRYSNLKLDFLFRFASKNYQTRIINNKNKNKIAIAFVSFLLFFSFPLVSFASDIDADGLPDNIELFLGTNPSLPDSDGNGISDADEDFDADGASNGDEVKFGHSPILPRYQVALGYFHTCVLDVSEVNCWGISNNDRLIVPSSVLNPIQIVAGTGFTCSLDGDGVVIFLW